MHDQHGKRSPSLNERLRIRWASARYDLWLDLRCTPRRVRRELTTELVSNLTEATEHVGMSQALENVGSLRDLAAETSIHDKTQPRWSSGIVAGLTALVSLLGLVFLQSLTWVEGVLDSGISDEVSSSLFPFLGSLVSVDPADGSGLALSVQPGPVPFVVALLVVIVVAKPWRILHTTSVVQA